MGTRLTALSRLSRMRASGGDAREIFRAVAEVAVTLLGARVARVWADDPGARVLRAAGSFGVDPEIEPRLLVGLAVRELGPEMSGPQVWEALREMDAALARRTVFCTGDVVSDEAKAFVASTGCPVVTKPFALARLLDAVAEAAAR